MKRKWHQLYNKLYRLSICDKLMLILSLFLCILMPVLSSDYGITGDEYVDYTHCGYVLRYYTEGLKEAVNQPQTLLHYYGISVQVIIRFITDTFNITDPYAVRHIICSLIGVAAIIYTGLFARKIGGSLCGFTAMLMLLLVPRFFGHSMNNLKDIPFAAGYIMSLYYTVRLFETYPQYRKRHILLLAFSVAFTMGNRAGGLILFPYILLYAAAVLWTKRKILNYAQPLSQRIIRDTAVVLSVLLLSYAGSIILWPYATEHILTAPFEALSVFTDFKVGIKQIFEGSQTLSDKLPYYYAAKFFLISLPVYILIGVLLFLVKILPAKIKNINIVFITFAAIFPLLWVTVNHSNLYGGIRHLLFIVPPLAVMSAYSTVNLFRQARRPLKALIIILVGVLLLLPLRHIIRSHPNQYIYFNEIIGGTVGAYGNYELDYYFNTEKQALDWLEHNIDITDTITLASHGRIQCYQTAAKINTIYTSYYERSRYYWDYAIIVNEYIDAYQLQHHLYPPCGTIKTIELDGKPLCAIVKRPSKHDYEGFTALEAGEYTEAAEHFTAYLEADPRNEQVLLGLARAYYGMGDYAEAAHYADSSLYHYPNYISALYLKTLILIKEESYSRAVVLIDKILDRKELAEIEYLKAVVLCKTKRYQEALELSEKILQKEPDNTEAQNLRIFLLQKSQINETDKR